MSAVGVIATAAHYGGVFGVLDRLIARTERRGFGRSAAASQLSLVLELLNLFNRPIRPFNLDGPTLTVAKHGVENGFCRCHGVETHTYNRLHLDSAIGS
jgi:hypothetical protein